MLRAEDSTASTHLGSGSRAAAPPSPSAAKSPRPRLSSHRRPEICCCPSEAAPHRLSGQGESVTKNTKADIVLPLLFILLGKHSGKSSAFSHKTAPRNNQFDGDLNR